MADPTRNSCDIDAPASSPSRRLLADRNLHIVFGVTLTVVMGVSSVAPGFPKMAQALELSAAQVGLTITAFTVPGLVLTPVFGVLADRCGRRRILAPALLSFALFGGACGFVADYETLLVLRFLQGIGAAPLGALNITILSDLFEGRDRLTAMGMNAGVLAVGTTVYPVLGGALALLGWNAPYFLPFAVLPLAWLVAFRLKTPTPSRAEGLGDYLKSVGRAVAKPSALGLFISTIVAFAILYGMIIAHLPLYMAEIFEAESWAIGAVISTASLTTGAMSWSIGRLADRFSVRAILAAAFALFALSALIMPLAGSLWTMVIPVVVYGLAQGLKIPSSQALLARMAPADRRGAFLSVNATALRLGQTVGPLLPAASYAAMGSAFGDKSVFYAAAGLAAVTAIMIQLVIREPSDRDGDG